MDIGIMQLAAPEILRTWKISKAEMGSVSSSVSFGMAAGAAIAGPIGDRLDRKILVTTSVACVGLTTVLSALAHNVSIFLALCTLRVEQHWAWLSDSWSACAAGGVCWRRVVNSSQRYLKFERGAAAVSAASLRR
jgi:MFS family permease